MKTTSLEGVKQVEDQAAEWLVRRDAGEWSDSDQAALDLWLESSTANVVAFVRLETAWQRTHRLKSLGAGIPPGVVPSPDDWQLSPIFKAGPASRFDDEPVDPNPAGPSRLFHWALAASVLIAVIAGTWYLRPFASTYRTPIGGIAAVPMTDGSKVILNTDSEIRLMVTETERRVELTQGEAFFNVAKDPTRPFVVTAGNKRVTAIGTAFSVHRENDDIRVVVTEGKVVVAPAPSRELLGSHNPGASDGVILAAGGIAYSQRDRILLDHKPIFEVEDTLSWRTGFLTLRETPLAEASAEFNRYNARKIVVQDPRIAAIRLSGKFESTQYEAFIRLLEESFPIHVEDEKDQIVLTARQ